ncbi:hypothetical protein SAMN05877753_108120 [Bacillus oleivorans]|uniref:Uncharacterized protein n=1 Tax=Bacillus oleivorans TaxID=1448271 RepID=A0A285D2J4_9BACI|nr:hypothetical protein [Bacillus oleivorans]SNX74034.1 hypothetical protein SAMN05877753_108120 [Bacillus oleivorans]
MEEQDKLIFGAWVQAIGTVIAAIGSTPIQKLPSEWREAFSLWGNVMQATGNALVADGEDEFYERVGNEIQAIGNVTVVAGLVIEFEGDIGERLNITGNWMQSLGAATAFGYELDQEPDDSLPLEISGNLLQMLGNAMQALGGIYKLEEKKDRYSFSSKNHDDLSQSLEVNGSWIQAVGSVLSLLANLKETSNKAANSN